MEVWMYVYIYMYIYMYIYNMVMYMYMCIYIIYRCKVIIPQLEDSQLRAPCNLMEAWPLNLRHLLFGRWERVVI